MAMRKLLFILSVEFLLIFCSTSTAFGINSNDNKSVQSGDYLNSEVSNVNFDYYHEFFGLNSYGNTVITRYGKLPVLETMEQKKSWNSTLEELSNKIKDTIASKYMYPHGQVVTCGANDKGYFVILFNYGSVDEPLINKIYTVIDNSAREMGIHDIPVEFGYGTYYRADVPLSPDGSREYWFGERNVENLSESEIHVIEEYMKQKHEPLYKGGDIANYGTIPLFKDEKEFNTWGAKFDLIYYNVSEKIDAYMDKGQVRSFGIELTRLQVGIPENLSSEEKMTISKEIYPIIDGEARKQNMTDVPVAFQSVGNYTDVIANSNGNLTENSNGNLTENSNNNSENSDNISQRLPLTFGPETLNKLKSNPDFIAAYGSIPAFTTSEERDQWIDTLSEIMKEINANFDQEMSKYSYPNGPVTGCGVTIDGVIQVGINKSKTVDKPFMDEIYRIFDSKASKMGIKEVPVVFVHEDNPIPAVEIEPVVKTANLSIPGDKNTIELNNNSSANKSSNKRFAPGFELLGSLTCLFVVWKLRKK